MERNPFVDKNKEIHPSESHRFPSYSKNYAKGDQSSDRRETANRNKTDAKTNKSMNSISHTQDSQQTPSKLVPPPVATISPRIKMR